MLPNYSHLLVATDLSANSVEAFRHAVTLARRNKAQIHLLHVVPDVDASVRSYVSSLMGQGSLEKFEQQHEDEARELMEKRLRAFAEAELADHPDDLQRVNILVSHGQPVVEILQTAIKVSADVIVMASHGKGAIEHTFLGSVTEKVLRKSKKPVFVVPIP